MMNENLTGNIFLLMKQKLNYTTDRKSCKSCNFYEEDASTDNFGSGDHCGKNPDARFSVESTAVCDRHLQKDG